MEDLLLIVRRRTVDETLDEILGVRELEIVLEDVLVNCTVDETDIDAELEIGAVKVEETVKTDDNVTTVVTVFADEGRPLDVAVIDEEWVTR